MFTVKNVHMSNKRIPENISYCGGMGIVSFEKHGAKLELEQKGERVIIAKMCDITYEDGSSGQLRIGDTILCINGERVCEGVNQAEEYLQRLSTAGAPIHLQWSRDEDDPVSVHENTRNEDTKDETCVDYFDRHGKVHDDECKILSTQGMIDDLRCVIHLTSHRLIFEYEPTRTIFQVPLLCILKVVDLDSDTTLRIICKDIREIRIQATDKLVKVLKVLIKNDPMKRTMYAQPAHDLPGWKLFDPLSEYERIGLCGFLRMFFQDADYSVCSTYPRMVVVPGSVTDLDIQECASFRSRARFPAMSWVHPRTKAVLARCAQPLRGVGNATCAADERVVRALMGVTNPKIFGNSGSTSSSFSNFFSMDMDSYRQSDDYSFSDCESGRNYIIMDARSQMAAMGNQMLGKGTENPVNYPGSKLIFLNIENIHVVRTSFQRICELASPNYSGSCIYRSIADSGWLKQVISVLNASEILTRAISENGLSVLTHCSDGWDRTAQMCSLAMLWMDPYYRTLTGFAILIEKEWCAFGHKFAERYGNGINFDEQEYSPVFTLWIDCVYQTVLQFPNEFQFGEKFLVDLLDQVTSGYSATFLSDSHKHREHNKSSKVSVWTILFRNGAKYTNPNYKPYQQTLVPCISTKAIRFWETYYLRHDSSVRTLMHPTAR